ncbi:hypothetical protein K2173_007928 [Erythroxylum novogranatense]|uniref:J domain-containing protein n=1 Tax=Erythroxylum novogranatense TaxID=1862640 RepID=A0AAV8T843_9ROSI|nr:hypothetical protein K2173_007928 [Erythroxylum novogranatense]
MNESRNRSEAERLLGIAEKMLQTRDFTSTKDFALLAQETEPILEGPDQILAVVDVLVSAEKRINNHHDWYSILQIERRSDDNGLIRKQYRRLALLLHPDKNKYPFADQAFKLVADAWGVLSDSSKKSLYDKELSMFSRIDLTNTEKLPVRRGRKPSVHAKTNFNKSGGGSQYDEGQNQRAKLESFWTVCPYCYVLFEYPRVYEDCCLRCRNCQKAFHAVLLPTMPPLVPGKEAYYCCWSVFPLGFAFGSQEKGGEVSDTPPGFPKWMPPVFGNQNGGAAAESEKQPVRVQPPQVVETPAGAVGTTVDKRKRGRPRKYPPSV